MVAEEARQLMAQLGFRTIDEMVGRADVLDSSQAIEHWKADGLDLTALLARRKSLTKVSTCVLHAGPGSRAGKGARQSLIGTG